METKTVELRTRAGQAHLGEGLSTQVNEYESQGWAVRQLSIISSVWWIVVFERPIQTTLSTPITFDTPPTTWNTTFDGPREDK